MITTNTVDKVRCDTCWLPWQRGQETDGRDGERDKYGG